MAKTLESTRAAARNTPHTLHHTLAPVRAPSAPWMERVSLALAEGGRPIFPCKNTQQPAAYSSRWRSAPTLHRPSEMRRSIGYISSKSASGAGSEKGGFVRSCGR